jgi:aquaporin Z
MRNEFLVRVHTKRVITATNRATTLHARDGRDAMTTMTRRLAAEFLGTFWLVLGGCGAAVLAAAFKPETNLGIGLVGVSIAFGLTVLTGAYALAAVSGAHFNPAVTIGAWLSKRVESNVVLPYIVVQVIGAIAGAGVVWAIARGGPGFSLDDGLAANGYDSHSPGNYDLTSAIIVEVVLTAVFVLIILGTTARTAPASFAPLAIGLSLTLIHLISIPVTNTSVNPARSTGPAVFVGDWALEQLWLFWVAPIAGGIIGALLYRVVAPEELPATSEARPVDPV